MALVDRSLVCIFSWCGVLAGVFGCSASSDQGSSVERGSLGGMAPVPTGTSGGSDVVGFSGSGGGSGGGEQACATDHAEGRLSSEPVDVIIVLDNSGSMAEEMQAAEDNITVNFASVLDGASIDYRVILLSRHRKEARTASEEASTSICVSQPLSGLATCPSPLPVFSEKFYQYGEKIESHDALDWILEAYATPPEKDELAELAPNGWSDWVRTGAKKVFLIMTDDDEAGGDDEEEAPADAYTADSFLAALQAMAPEHFGSDPTMPEFTFHSIIGILQKDDVTAAYESGEPIEHETCTGNGADIVNAGETYQELSQDSGGLRFPLCEFGHYDTVFRAIAADVILKADLQCDFAIPAPPPGRELLPENVAVQHLSSDGAAEELIHVLGPEECRADAFYTLDERVWLCPEACDAIKVNPGQGVDVLFRCENQIVEPE